MNSTLPTSEIKAVTCGGDGEVLPSLEVGDDLAAVDGPAECEGSDRGDTRSPEDTRCHPLAGNVTDVAAKMREHADQPKNTEPPEIHRGDPRHAVPAGEIVGDVGRPVRGSGRI